MERSRQFYIEKIDGTCVRLEPLLQNVAPAGEGMKAVIIETTESTPASSFWGPSAGACHRFSVRVRRVG